MSHTNKLDSADWGRSWTALRIPHDLQCAMLLLIANANVASVRLSELLAVLVQRQSDSKTASVQDHGTEIG